MNYVRATTVNEAVELLREAGSSGLLLAGGTDVMVAMNAKPAPVETTIIDIGSLDELKEIREDDDSLRIGALVTAAELAVSPVVHVWAEALAQAAAASAGPQVRNRATIGGNIGTASPAGDLISALYALDATVVIAGPEGCCEKKINEVVVGVKRTSLCGGIITELVIPKTCPGCTSSAFEKMGKRKAMTVSLANVSCRIKLSETKDSIEEARVVVGSAAATVVRALDVEQALKGAALDEENIRECAKLVTGSIDPITDQRATRWYRLEVIPVMVAKAVSKAISQLKE